MPYDGLCCSRWPSMPARPVTGHPKRDRRKQAAKRREAKKARR